MTVKRRDRPPRGAPVVPFGHGAESAPSRARRVLAIVATDSTFHRREVRGERLWVGKCIHCGAQISVAEDGTLLASATVEHIVPRHHGGGDDLANLALACARCNGGKGVRHDSKPRGDAKLEAMIALLAARRAERWRPPGDPV